MLNLIKKFIVAIYIRLSQEDEKELKNKNGTIDSESVINQRTLLTKYVNDNDYILYKVYIDDGYTGTNFDRPAFKEMIKDIEAGKVNMVVTKDLSRLGRDYIETGKYVEKWFPSHNVRYVSLLDGVDTFLDTNNNEIAPFKAIINDMYSRDNSKKIRAALHSMQDDGKWVGGCTPLGYMQDPKDKNHLVINEEEAPIVRKIFKWAGEGMSTYHIRERLIAEKVPTAQMLRNRRPTKRNSDASKGLWSTKTVQGILTNQLYTGDMVQNRRSRISYKIRKVVHNSKEDWKIVRNTHEAFIDRREFNRIQKVIASSNRSTKKVIRCLDGLLYCYECKHRITINSPRKTDGKTYITCNYYRLYSKLGLCTSHGFNYDLLEESILDVCREIFKNCLDKDYLKNKVISNSDSTAKLANLNNAKLKLETLIKKSYDNLDKMYLDNIEGKIDDSMYNRLSNKIKLEIESNEDKLKIIEEQLNNSDNLEEEKIFRDGRTV